MPASSKRLHFSRLHLANQTTDFGLKVSNKRRAATRSNVVFALNRSCGAAASPTPGGERGPSFPALTRPWGWPTSLRRSSTEPVVYADRSISDDPRPALRTFKTLISELSAWLEACDPTSKLPTREKFDMDHDRHKPNNITIIVREFVIGGISE
ncbi:hypothetical protein CLG85_017635 [Yangia mangrovi]|uniref:Uncharacterized protein n=1 Tax=Alloyangia mangrovi TaxID=1779329 RepID=A0ABT2KPN0_9RHOB|nr:hypothetical protein [Alloyangia mangrovi]MCT4372040.1 hypothetical protein [Alloyangia mangrovi]